MLRLARLAIPMALVLALFVQTDAFAATVNVSETNFVFTPKVAKLRMGDTVTWTNNSTSSHTATSDTPLSLFDSGTMAPGATFSFAFTAAGIYAYHCTFHQAQGMTGMVGSKDTVFPLSGPVGTMFTITVATIPAPAGFTYDIQKRNPGGSFQNWMLGVTSASVIFDSTGQPTGVYQFRSRLHQTSNNAVSGYSPGQNLTVTT
jgi:plastocyanin